MKNKLLTKHINKLQRKIQACIIGNDNSKDRNQPVTKKHTDRREKSNTN